MSVTFKHEDDGKHGKFTIYENDLVAGDIMYTWLNDNKFVIEHTIVDKAFGGKGYAKQLVMKVVELARKKKIKVATHCSYAKSVFDRDATLADVISTDD